MRILLLALGLFLAAASASAQNQPVEQVAAVADSLEGQDFPTLVGGLIGLASRIVYPEAARAARIQGSVFVQFVVAADGSTSDFKIIRSPNEFLSSEAIRVVRASTFEPAEKDGAPVAAQLVLPIQFVLH